MTVRITRQGCRVETICTILPLGRYDEEVILSVDPASQLSLVIEEHASRAQAPRDELPARGTSRVRATRYGFELVERR